MGAAFPKRVALVPPFEALLESKSEDDVASILAHYTRTDDFGISLDAREAAALLKIDLENGEQVVRALCRPGTSCGDDRISAPALLCCLAILHAPGVSSASSASSPTSTRSGNVAGFERKQPGTESSAGTTAPQEPKPSSPPAAEKDLASSKGIAEPEAKGCVPPNEASKAEEKHQSEPPTLHGSAPQEETATATQSQAGGSEAKENTNEPGSPVTSPANQLPGQDHPALKLSGTDSSDEVNPQHQEPAPRSRQVKRQEQDQGPGQVSWSTPALRAHLRERAAFVFDIFATDAGSTLTPEELSGLFTVALRGLKVSLGIGTSWSDEREVLSQAGNRLFTRLGIPLKQTRRFKVGQSVQGQYKGKAKWYRGTIARVLDEHDPNGEGYFEVRYVDGEVEEKVHTRRIKAEDPTEVEVLGGSMEKEVFLQWVDKKFLEFRGRVSPMALRKWLD